MAFSRASIKIGNLTSQRTTHHDDSEAPLVHGGGRSARANNHKRRGRHQFKRVNKDSMIMCAENDADGKEKIKEETTQNKIDSPVSEVSSSNDSEKNHTFVRHTNKSHKLVLDDSKNQFSSSPCKNQKKNNIKNIVNKSSANIMVEHENISTTMSSLLNGSCPSRATTLQLCGWCCFI